MTFLEAARTILEQAGEPLHYAEITRRALEAGLLETQGRTPDATMSAQIGTNIKSGSSPFVRVRPATYALRAWIADGKLDLDEESVKTLVSRLPRYGHLRALLPIWDGAPATTIQQMRAALEGARAAGDATLDWNDPDEWIGQRLDGEAAEWARKIWEGSDKQVNPRYIGGYWYLALNHGLVKELDGVLRVTERGQAFRGQPLGEVEREVDEEEGVLKILALIAESGSVAPAELVEPWADYLRAETNVRADSAARALLYHRTRNLLERELIERGGREYTVTPAGMTYLAPDGTGPRADPITAIRQLQEEMRVSVKESLRDLLYEMDPFHFEQVICQLLELMGYVDTEVTSPSNDKGVDVVGAIRVGITEVREVVQAKRFKAGSNVGRRTVDMLRGVLHRFGAVRGTIITTSGFASGAKKAAVEVGGAPVTLIDGETLVELMVEHGLGVTKKSLEVWELNPDDLSAGTHE